MVQWLGLRASTAGGTGSIPGQGTKILQATWRGQKKKKMRSIKTTLENCLAGSGKAEPMRTTRTCNFSPGYVPKDVHPQELECSQHLPTMV